MVPVGGYIVNTVIIILLFALLLFISWLISRKIKKNIFIIAIILWMIIFIINVSMCLIGCPWVMAIKNTAALDGSVNGKYISLGYGIKIEGHNPFEKSNIEMHIISLLDTFR